ncbi:MAG: DsrE family protein [Gammaproteobacteria bacterium]|nr:MAG: DsrE family protein [Gammaproteobacteria bacterium]
MEKSTTHNKPRRILLKSIGLLGGVFAIRRADAHHTETHFEDTTAHRIVYQCNKIDPEYLQHILFSVGELLRKYGDDIEIVVAAFGHGLHLLARHPLRPIPEELRQRVSSLADYGVAFHACGNTMKSLRWSEKDLYDFAKVVPVGVDDIMQLQEKGFAYMSW